MRSFIRSRYPLALLAGLLLAISFPNFGVAGFAWVMPGMILFLAIGTTPKQAFRVGYAAGVAHYLLSLDWLLNIPVPWVWAWSKVLGWGALGAFLALYPAIWVWLAWKIFPGKFDQPPGIKKCAEQFFSVSWSRRLVWALACAAIWVALEMTVARFLGGFPWNLLGDSQFRIVPLIQISSVTGVYGVSFLLVWFSVSLMSAMMALLRSPKHRSALVGEIIVPALAASIVFAAGYHQMLQPVAKQRELTIALVQPSIPQSVIWDPAESNFRFQQLLQLSEQSLAKHADVLIWPEAAVPGMVAWDTNIFDAISELARKHKVWMVIGSDDFVPHTNATSWKDGDYYNSSFLVSSTGKLAETYKKRNLVIFGEYVPLIKWLPFLKYLTPIEGGFASGDRVVPFIMPGLKAKISVLICFEDVFPHLVREYVSDDTDFLVNLTNNGWFGEGSAQWQHAAAAIFRAVENGVPLVRCSNNGLTCWIDANGRVRQYFESDTRGIYGPGYMIAHVPVLAPGEKRAPTFYRLHGDWFGWGCVVVALTKVVLAWIRDRNSRKPLTG